MKKQRALEAHTINKATHLEVVQADKEEALVTKTMVTKTMAVLKILNNYKKLVMLRDQGMNQEAEAEVVEEATKNKEEIEINTLIMIMILIHKVNY